MTVTVNGKKVASHSESHGRYENFRKGIAKKMKGKSWIESGATGTMSKQNKRDVEKRIKDTGSVFGSR